MLDTDQDATPSPNQDEEDHQPCPEVADEPTPAACTSSFDSKGEILGVGVSEIVELSPQGHAIKSPWPPPRSDNTDDENYEIEAVLHQDSLDDLKFEARIYQHFGLHPRLVGIVDWDQDECVLTMEYMPNGTLKDYLQNHNTTIFIEQRRQWVKQIIQGLEYHYDFKPKNLSLDKDLEIKSKNLSLDKDLEIKIADFGCSSLHGSKPTGGAG